jgi:hypothetical protein
MPIDGPPIAPPAIYLEMRQTRTIEEQILSGPQVARLCMDWSVTYKFAPPPPGEQFLGCSLRWPDRCKVVRIDREDVRVHELAHCAGWAPDHPPR